MVLRADREFSAKGTWQAGRVRVAGPKKLVLVCVKGPPPPKKDDGSWHLGATQPYSLDNPQFHAFDGTLKDGRYEPPEQVIKNKDGGICRITTRMVAGGSEIDARADRDIILAAGTGATAIAPTRKGFEFELKGGPGYNIIRFKVPDNISNREAIKENKLHLRATVASKSGQGRLFHLEPGTTPSFSAEGRRELNWDSRHIKPGTEQNFCYRWIGEPPKELHHELIEFKVFKEGKTATRDIRFEVGLDLEIVAITRTLTGDIWTGRREPLVIKVQDGFNAKRKKPISDLGEFLRERGLVPVLRVRRCDYRPTPYNEILSLFRPEAARFSPTATDAKYLTSRVEEIADLWALPLEGDTLQIHKTGPGSNPAIVFQAMGDHAFEVRIAGLVRGKEARHLSRPEDIEIPDPKREWPQGGCSNDPALNDLYKPKPGQCPENCWVSNWSETSNKAPVHFAKNTLMIAVTQAPPEDRLARAIADCVKAAITKKPGPIIACVWRTVFTVPGAIGDLVDSSKAARLDAAALAASQIIDPDDHGARPGTPYRKAGEPADAADVSRVLKGLKGVRIVMLSRDAAADIAAESGLAGGLKWGKTPADIAKGLMERHAEKAGKAPAAPDVPPASRMIKSKRYVFIPLLEGEDLKLNMSGTGKDGELVLVTGGQVSRVKLPSGRWKSTLRIDSESEIRHISGTQLEVGTPEPTPQPRPQPAAGRFGGTWRTNFGTMQLTVEGNKVTGTFGDSGRVEGRLSDCGKHVSGRWSEGPTHRPPDAGRFLFTISAGAKTFTGRFGYGEKEPHMPWKGTRVE